MVELTAFYDETKAGNVAGLTAPASSPASVTTGTRAWPTPDAMGRVMNGGQWALSTQASSRRLLLEGRGIDRSVGLGMGRGVVLGQAASTDGRDELATACSYRVRPGLSAPTSARRSPSTRRTRRP